MHMIKFSPLRQYVDRKNGTSLQGFWSDVNDIFNSFSDAGLPDTFKSVSYVPALDVKEDEKNLVVQAELPGLEESDIDVSLNEGVLTLKGEKKTEEKKETDKFVRIERSFGSFHRSVTLPSEVDASKIEAIFKNGVLTITLPKVVQERKEQKIKIKTQ